jgi:hypothetical protein
MKWIKKGVIFAPDSNFDWMVSHASIPVIDDVRPGLLRIYFGTRDRNGRSHTSYIEVETARPENVVYIHDKPLLSLGRPGTFDDSGIMPSWLVNHEQKKYLYYIGWNPTVTVPYHLSIGLAISEDAGRTFSKVSEGPVLDRSFDEPFFNTAPCVLHDEGKWRMWYVSCTEWDTAGERPEPRYHVKHAESSDGVSWRRTNHVCIDYGPTRDAIGRPCVYKENGSYKMIYSYRGVRGYRTDRAQSYRLGYAESIDGLNWITRDQDVGIERSASGWDSEMMEYCYRYQYEGGTYLFYNGNGFGKTGIGYAVLADTLADLPDQQSYR